MLLQSESLVVQVWREGELCRGKVIEEPKVSGRQEGGVGFKGAGIPACSGLQD
jgi:hypothetical protein